MCVDVCCVDVCCVDVCCVDVCCVDVWMSGQRLTAVATRKEGFSDTNTVKNICIALIAHHVNHLNVLSCSSIHSD